MIDINKNYPVTIITSSEVIAIIAKGDREGQVIFRLRFHESGNGTTMKSPAHLSVDPREFAETMLQEVFSHFENVHVYDVPAGLTPEEFLAWGTEQDLFNVSPMRMIQ
jgi:hypothetical protein